MNTWSDSETFEHEVEAAARLGRGVVEHFRTLTRAAGWNGGDLDG